MRNLLKCDGRNLSKCCSTFPCLHYGLSVLKGKSRVTKIHVSTDCARTPLSMSSTGLGAHTSIHVKHRTGCIHPSLLIKYRTGCIHPSIHVKHRTGCVHPSIHVKCRSGCMHPSSFGELYKAVWKKLRNGDRTWLSQGHKERECGKQNSTLTKRKPKFWIYLFHYMLFKPLRLCI